MKLQHVSVLFVVIFVPILLVTTYFIKLQVKTVKLESSYDEKLLNATYDAMTAFELNTANEDLSSVSDSLRSIIDASNNIFFNTLCTNLGISNASKSFVQPYIPAILYTLYDGYYIYSPTNIPEICVDKYGRTIRTSDYGVSYVGIVNGVGIYSFNQDSIVYSKFTPTVPAGEDTSVVGDLIQTAPTVAYSTLPNNIKAEYGQILYKNNDGTYSTSLHSFSGNSSQSTYYKRDYILKSYIPYSARYVKDNIDIVINYTLDNFMTVEGKIGEIYFSKSGYLINNNLVQSIEVKDLTAGFRIVNINSSNPNAWKNCSEEELDSYIYNPSGYEVKIKLSDGLEFTNRDGRVKVNIRDSSGNIGEEVRYWDDAQSAMEYYVDSFIFSKWFYENFSSLQAKDLVNTQYSVSDIQNDVLQDISSDKTQLYKSMLNDFSGDTSFPFQINDNDPESEESTFYKHKRNIIKNSITYNLILSMLVYTEESKTVEFNMPVLNETEWDRILKNVSIVSFMEGMRCGLKYYNNYAIVTSTNNEITVTDNEIYYVPRVLEHLTRVENGSTVAYNIISAIDDDETDYPKTGNPHYEYSIDLNETAHRIDCSELVLNSSDNFYGSENVWLGCFSFKSKEIKYDKILDSSGKYIYDHKVYTDYNCIVDPNYTVKNVDGTTEDGNTDVVKYLTKNVANNSPEDANLKSNLEYKLRAYRIAIAKERNNLYKTSAFANNYGFQVIQLGNKDAGAVATTNGNVTISGNNITSLTDRNIRNIKKIEVTIEGASQVKLGVYTTPVTVKLNNYSYDYIQTIATTSTNRRTLEFSQDFDTNEILNTINISAPDVNFYVNSIKIYYK